MCVLPGKTTSSSCATIVMVRGRAVTTNRDRGVVCWPSVTVKLKPPDSSPGGRQICIIHLCFLFKKCTIHVYMESLLFPHESHEHPSEVLTLVDEDDLPFVDVRLGEIEDALIG